MENYESLREKHKEMFEKMEAIPYESEHILTNRVEMQNLIKRVNIAFFTNLLFYSAVYPHNLSIHF